MAPTSGTVLPPTTKVRRIDFISFISKLVFTLSILLALGVVGYKWYLNYSIKKMGLELEAARQEIAGGVVGELVDLNNRITSTETLVKDHQVLSPLFTFFQSSTPKSVRFTELNYSMGETGPQIDARGQATSYSALALESNAISKNTDIKDAVFSDIRLDEKGNVTFAFKAIVTPNFLSYQKAITRQPAPAQTQIVPTVATSTATTTGKTATTTPKTSTSTSPR